MVELVVVDPKGNKKKLSFQKKVIAIGRKSDNDVVINDSEMSRYHASIRFENGTYSIYDLNSTNGIFFHDKRIREKQELSPQIEIKIGSHSIIFVRSDADKDSKSPPVQKTPKAAPAKPAPPPPPEKDANGEIGIEDQEHTFFLPVGDLVKKATEFEVKDQERSQAITHVEGVNKNLEILYNIGKQLLNIKDIKGISSLLIENVEKVVQAERIAIQLKNEDEELETFNFKVSTGDKNFKLSKTITNKVLNEGVAIISSNAQSDDRFASGASVIMQVIRAMMCIPIWKDEDFMGLIYIDNQNSLMGFKETDLQILSAIANQAAIGIDNIRLNENIREEIKFRNNLERYHSPDVIDMIMTSSDSLFAAVEKEATILFSDIKGFTSLSEKFSAIEISEILNEYFDEMTEAIFENKGTLDKFIGDAIMAIFGAPISYENDAFNAVNAALDMIRTHKKLMSGKLPERQFGIRVGINSGKVVAGNIGSQKRVDYTVLGDVVNIASRLETMANTNSVFIGESTYSLVKDDFEFKEVGHSKLKGKAQSVMVYEVLDVKKK